MSDDNEHAEHSPSQRLTISKKLLKRISKRSLSDYSDSGESSANTDGPHQSSFDMAASTQAPLKSKLLERQANIDQAHQKDPSYRKYVLLIEKNLATFEAVNEWADIISFLGRLHRSFQAYPQFTTIPRKDTVAKRLAQCLNPGFPAGVHQKTLDVYAYILETIGTDQLAEDLPLWSTGLFPFVQHASTHVKPQVLGILEKYYLPLQGRLRPAMRGFTIALLPALEEEGNESFDKAVSLLVRLAETVELSFFYSCLWLVMITSPGLRPPALNYLLRKFPKMVGREEVALALGSDENMSLMVGAFSATLSDKGLLVQRGMLELLVQNISLQNRMIPHDELVQLMRAALSIVLRKDMSLNRRLYAWLLGTEGTPQTQLHYFLNYAEKPATQAIRSMFFVSVDETMHDHETAVAEAQKPYKVLISLMDRWEIGQPVVNNIFLDALKSCQGHVRRGSFGVDILRTANMWMEMVGPYLIWMKLFEVLDGSFPGKGAAVSSVQANLESLRLVDFALKSFKLSDEEVKQMHLPLVLVSLVCKLHESICLPSFLTILPNVIQCIELIDFILQQLPETIFTDKPLVKSSEKDTGRKQCLPGMDVLAYARDFYGLTGGRTLEKAKSNADESGLGTPGGDEGDLSSQMQKSPTFADVSVLMARPEFDPLRPSVLVQELTSHLTQFTVELVKKLHARGDVDVGEAQPQNVDSQIERVLHAVCSLLLTVTRAMAKHTDAKQSLEWKESDKTVLTQALLSCCREGHEFGVIDAGLATLAHIVQGQPFLDTAALKNKAIVKLIMDKLWGYLSPNMQLLHRRTVELIWLLTRASLRHQVETIMTDYLITDDDEERVANFEKFGVFWALSENDPDTSTYFSRPMFFVLDLLGEHATPVDRRAAESWIRCHMRSYTRLLDPFLQATLDSRIKRRSTVKTIPYDNQILKDRQNGAVQVHYAIYLRPFDMATVDYMFKTLVSLIRFGGLHVLRSSKKHALGTKGELPMLVQEILGINVNDDSSSLSYLELLVHMALLYLDSEPWEKLHETMMKPVRSIQLHAADLLYLILSKLDHVDMAMTRLVHERVLRKLLYCITTGNLELQPRLLHLVHTTMAISATNALGSKPAANASQRHLRQKSSATERGASSMDTLPFVTDTPSHPPAAHSVKEDSIALITSTFELFVKCVVDALVMTSNRSLLQQWMDFVLATLPHLRGGFRQMVVPLLLCVCEQITLCHTTMQLLMHGDSGAEMARGSMIGQGPFIQERGAAMGGAEKEITILLNGLEKMLMFCLSERTLSDDWYPPDKLKLYRLPIPQMAEHSSFDGFARLAHGDEDARRGGGLFKPREAILYQLPVVLHMLLNVWRVCRAPAWDDTTGGGVLGYAKKGAVLQGFASAADHIKARLETTFKALYEHCPTEFTEGWTEIFFMENPIALEYEVPSEQYDLMMINLFSAIPGCSPRLIMATLLDGIRRRQPVVDPRRHPILRDGKLTDTSIMRFAEICCSSLITADHVDDLWRIIHHFAKECLSEAGASKTFLPGLLRFLTVALDALIHAAGSEDKKMRMRKDAQDVYPRCVDNCILIAGRAFDQSLWSRRTQTPDDEGSAAAHVDTTLLSDALANDLPRNMSTSNVSELEKKASWKSHEENLISQVNMYFATAVIPRLRELVGDQDKINSLLNNMVYYVIGPALRTRTIKMGVILDQLCAMARMPFANRTWRKEVWEMFIDHRFFYMSATAAKKWQTMMQAVMSSEKERFAELVGRIMTPSSTTFFSNKDQETLNCALNLRRLSFVIFCGAVDQYVPQLPMIQEKLVDLLKLEHGEMVHTEIYLCLRVMLLRFSHLHNFWPVLVTELMRLFNAFLYSSGHDRPEDAQVALAGCKFLDLLCTLEVDAFQIYQWIFIRDTLETRVQSNAEGPIPIMELMEEKLAEASHSTHEAFSGDMVPTRRSLVPSVGELKRPMLTMHSIGSIQQLGFFVAHIGLYMYQSSFTLARPDMPFIESLLLNDFLDGDIDSDS